MNAIERKSSREIYGLYQRILEVRFGKQREAWSEVHRDDRAVFCSIYDMLMDACEIMKDIENVTICVAFNAKFREDEATLKRIAEVFKGR